MAAKKSTDVIIAGKSYTLSGYEEEGYLQRIADYINQKIAEMDESGVKRRIPSETRAILIGLNMANDYYKIRDQFDSVEENYKKTEKELFQLKHELVDTQMRVDELLADLEKEKKKSKAKPAVDKDLQERCQKLEADYKELSEKSTAQSQDYQKLESKYQALSEHSKQLEEANAKLENECKVLADTPQKSPEDYEKLESEKKILETEKKALESEVQELRLNKKRLEKTLEDALLGALQSEQEKEEEAKTDQVLSEEEELQELARQIEELERQEQQEKLSETNE